MPLTICVDLNGVLDTRRGWWGQAGWHAPREGAAGIDRKPGRRADGARHPDGSE